MLRKWRKNSQILIWSLSSPLNKAKERKTSALCLRKEDDMGNKMRSKCFSRLFLYYYDVLYKTFFIKKFSLKN